MAGTNPRFNSAAFKRGIRFAMEMGAPPNDGERATFYFETELHYTGPVDDDGIPFDPNVLATRVTPPNKRVTCAVEYFNAQGEPTNFGLVVPDKAAVILLDDEYAQIKTCIGVLLRGYPFIYKSTDMPNGLFDVGVYTMHFEAKDAG